MVSVGPQMELTATQTVWRDTLSQAARPNQLSACLSPSTGAFPTCWSCICAGQKKVRDASLHTFCKNKFLVIFFFWSNLFPVVCVSAEEEEELKKSAVVNWYLKEIESEIDSEEELVNKKGLIEKVLHRLVHYVSPHAANIQDGGRFVFDFT